MKSIRINLNTLAKQYGLVLLTAATVEYNEDGEPSLVLEGEHDRK
jgi:hypothetical protein